MLEKYQKRLRRHKRVRAKVFGTTQRPRLSVFRSAKHIYAQIIDDEKGGTLVAASDLEFRKSKIKNLPRRQAGQKSKIQIEKKKIEKDEEISKGKVLIAYQVGKLLAQKALKKQIKQVVLDRGGFKYHGRIKSLADGAREAGLKF